MKKVRIVFFGSSSHSLPTLKTIFKKKGYEITAIVSQPDRPVGRKQILTPTPVSEFAQEHKIPLFAPLSQKNKPWLYQNPKKLASQLSVLNPDLLISVYYGQKVSQEIINLAKFGGLNLHPSLLPKYRGASPVKWAIYNGEKETGTTLLKIAKNFDQGEIVVQEKEKIKATDTAETLYARLFQKAAKLLIKTIPDYINGKIKLTKQDNSQASYYPRLIREHGFIKTKDLQQALEGKSIKIARQIERQIRAFHPWPSTYSLVSFYDRSKKLNRQRIPQQAKRLKILKAHLEKGKLVLDLVQLEGKKPVSFKQFQKAYPNFQFPTH